MGRKNDDDIEDLAGDEDLPEQDEADDADGSTEVVEDESTADEGAEEGEFSEAIADDVLDEYDETDIDLKVVDEVLSQKDQNARALAIRRAIEERLEAKRLSRDLDYLDLDVDD